MKVWVPVEELAGVATAFPGVEVGVYAGGEDVPPDVESVEFYVPPFMPTSNGAEVMAEMPNLRVVQTLTAGVEALRSHVPEGVTLCNARGAHDASTAEWVVGAILATLHDFPHFAGAQRQRRWKQHFTDALAGKTVLIVGYGSIGAAVERRLAGFEVETVRVARSARAGVQPIERLPQLLPDADVVVLLVPVTAETIGLMDASMLARMGDGALLVNAARGTIVDTDALMDELRSGRLRAAMDVTDPEPLPENHPLWELPGVFVTPHIAGSTGVSAQRAAELVGTQLERYVTGQSLANIVSGHY